MVAEQTKGVEETQVEAFQATMRGNVIMPEQANYDEVRQIWNGMHDKRPALIARCTGRRGRCDRGSEVCL